MSVHAWQSCFELCQACRFPGSGVYYACPARLTDEVLAAFRDVPNVLPYLNLPLQHSHPEIPQAMNRPWQKGVTRAVAGLDPRSAPHEIAVLGGGGCSGLMAATLVSALGLPR